MAIPIFLVSHWYLSLFSQSFFLHRYAAHRMFSMSKFWERVFFIMSYVSQGASYLNPRAYAILHRLHHAYSDTQEDPHSPHHSTNVFTMMWRTRREYVEILKERAKIPGKFLGGYPTWKRLEGVAESWGSRIGWGAAYVAYYVIFDASWWMFFFLPIHFLMGPIQGAVVNYLGHKLGYQNFDNKDKSKNTLVFDLVTVGELFQNNHHKFPLKPNFGVRWFELDPTYWAVRVFDWMGVIRLKRRAAAKKAALAAADEATHNDEQ